MQNYQTSESKKLDKLHAKSYSHIYVNAVVNIAKYSTLNYG